MKIEELLKTALEKRVDAENADAVRYWAGYLDGIRATVAALKEDLKEIK